jgi:hypothetical protein
MEFQRVHFKFLPLSIVVVLTKQLLFATKTQRHKAAQSFLCTFLRGSASSGTSLRLCGYIAAFKTALKPNTGRRKFEMRPILTTPYLFPLFLVRLFIIEQKQSFEKKYTFFIAFICMPHRPGPAAARQHLPEFLYRQP